MAIKLHRFPISHFSEKGRALLDFKELDYEIVEHQLGLSQLAVYRLSGQRKVPVIEHDGKVVADSTEIALYLERTFPERRKLLPADEGRRRDVLELEDRLDRVFAIAGVVAWIDAIRDQPDMVARALGTEVYGVGRRTARALALLAKRGPRGGLVARSNAKTARMLSELCDRLATSKYLVGDEPSLADIAAVGLTLHLEFPHSKYLGIPDFAGIGAHGWADNPDYARFFEWRRRFYKDFLK